MIVSINRVISLDSSQNATSLLSMKGEIFYEDC